MSELYYTGMFKNCFFMFLESFKPFMASSHEFKTCCQTVLFFWSKHWEMKQFSSYIRLWIAKKTECLWGWIKSPFVNQKPQPPYLWCSYNTTCHVLDCEMVVLQIKGIFCNLCFIKIQYNNTGLITYGRNKCIKAISVITIKRNTIE